MANPPLPPRTGITVPSQDGSRLACSTRNFEVFIIDSRNGRILAGPILHPSDITYLRFSPDGLTLTTTARDKSLRIWSVSTGEALTPAIELPEYATDIDVRRGGRTVLAASNNGSASLFDFPPCVLSVEEMRLKARDLAGGADAR